MMILPNVKLSFVRYFIIYSKCKNLTSLGGPLEIIRQAACGSPRGLDSTGLVYAT